MADTDEQPKKKEASKEEEYLAGWKRAAADLDNYKKEELERLQQATASERRSCVEQLLPIIDAFEEAEAQMPDDLRERPEVIGILYIKQNFEQVLTSYDVERIPTIGEPFNPELHEALSETDSDEAAGTVIEEHRAGYTCHGQVMRPAQVIISK